MMDDMEGSDEIWCHQPESFSEVEEETFPVFYSGTSLLQRRNFKWILRQNMCPLLVSCVNQNLVMMLHIECGCGDVTRDAIYSYFKHGSYNLIVGVDNSEEMTNNIPRSLCLPGTLFEVLDITNERDVKSFFGFKLFTKIFCFSCRHWIRNPRKALEHTSRLLANNGECLFAFIGHSPVYDSYEKLAEDPRWANCMTDYQAYIPFTHNAEKPHESLMAFMVEAGLKVVHYETREVKIYDPSIKDVKEHVSDVNRFMRCIPINLKSEFIEECMKLMSDFQTSGFLCYKIVIAHAIKVPETPEEGASNKTQKCSSMDGLNEEPESSAQGTLKVKSEYSAQVTMKQECPAEDASSEQECPAQETTNEQQECPVEDSSEQECLAQCTLNEEKECSAQSTVPEKHELSIQGWFKKILDLFQDDSEPDKMDEEQCDDDEDIPTEFFGCSTS